MIGFTACQQEEIVEAPEFTVYDSNETAVFTLQGGEQYEYASTYFQQSVAADKGNEIAKGEIFTIRSNRSWRIVSQESEYDWVKPFPESGEDDGHLTFLIDRNNDQNNAREAYFKVILNDGTNDQELSGMFIIKQDKCVDFLKTSVAKLEVYKEGSNQTNVKITSNVDWTYELVPDASYGTDNLDWITVLNEDEPLEKTFTLQFAFEENVQNIRGAILKINSTTHPDLNKELPVTQYGVEVEAVGFPVEWKSSTGVYPNWPGSGTIDPVTGSGHIKFVFGRTEHIGHANTLLDISASNPRVQGVWPGDYWEFKANAPVSAGALIKLEFSSRSSAKGLKFWKLEYRDGSEWKLASPALTTTLANPEETITYTHTLVNNSNQTISSLVKYQNTTDEVVFRFTCVSNARSSDETRLTEPTTATSRLDCDGGDEKEPSISCVVAGYEDLRASNIVVEGVKDNLITFEGSKVVPVTFNVTSDADFSVVAESDWIIVENGTGFAGETKEVTVSCLESQLNTSRRGMVVVKSGITKYYINVVQSSAGQELEPFISLSNGNFVSVLGEGEEFSARVQTNTEYVVECSEWIEEVIVPQSKAIVEWFDHKFVAKPNTTGAEREGFVRFINNESGIETVLNVKQENFVARVDISPVVKGMGISGYGATVSYMIDANVDYKVSTEAAWVTLPAGQGPKGVITVPIVYASNDQASDRVATITFTNEDYGFSKSVQITQFPSNIYFQDDFTWVKPWADKYGSADSVGEDAASGKAPNVYSQETHLEGGVEGYPAFLTAYAEMGYEDVNPSAKSFYTQKYYLKFGASNKHTGIKLPYLQLSAATDVELSFNYCMHMTGSGNIDKGKLIVEIEGEGVCADTNVKISSELTTNQTKGNLEWYDAKIVLKGVTSSSRISIRPTVLDDSDGVTQKRWHIDNIVIK